MIDKKFSPRIPDVITLINLTLGFYAILYSLESEYSKAAILILFAMIADTFDGFFSRAFRGESRFGMELDSLADMVSFGVAPSILVYTYYFNSTGAIIIAAIPLCGAIRLAKFNIIEDKKRFTGLPIPAVGGFFASLVLTAKSFNTNYILLAIIVLSYLMISKIKYPRYMRINFKRPPKLLILLLLSGIPIVFGMEYFVIPILTYILLGIVIECANIITKSTEA